MGTLQYFPQSYALLLLSNHSGVESIDFSLTYGRKHVSHRAGIISLAAINKPAIGPTTLRIPQALLLPTQEPLPR